MSRPTHPALARPVSARPTQSLRNRYRAMQSWRRYSAKAWHGRQDTGPATMWAGLMIRPLPGDVVEIRRVRDKSLVPAELVETAHVSFRLARIRAKAGGAWRDSVPELLATFRKLAAKLPG